MILVFNRLALAFGISSAALAFAAGSALGWIAFEKGKSSPHEDYVAFLLSGLLILADLIWRMRKVTTINDPGPPTIITRQGPKAPKPEPVTKLLNIFLSGEYGAQFFWVIPGWVVGSLLIWIAWASRQPR